MDKKFLLSENKTYKQEDYTPYNQLGAIAHSNTNYS
jgi:hypothetical protein